MANIQYVLLSQNGFPALLLTRQHPPNLSLPFIHSFYKHLLSTYNKQRLQKQEALWLFTARCGERAYRTTIQRGKPSFMRWDPCGGCTEEGPGTHHGPERKGLGRLSAVKPKLRLREGCVRLKPSCGCQRGPHFRQRGQFKEDPEGRCSMDTWRPPCRPIS